MPRCFALFSGGLDSAIAIKTMQVAGVDVIALNFVSHFFGGPSEKLQHMADQLQVPVLFVPFHEQQLAATVNPKAGRGKNFNACIDCHATMLSIAGQMMKTYQVDFLVTGEVLGQRPMSQNSQALQQVAKMSGYGDLILRPLSGQQLATDSFLEKFGLQRSQLHAIEGRSTTQQEQLATSFGLTKYPSHGGGCILTEPSFAAKMKTLHKDQVICEQTQFVYKCMRNGRVLRYGDSQYLVVGRSQAENAFLDQFRKYGEYCSAGDNLEMVGPTILILDFSSVKNVGIQFKQIELLETDLEDLKGGKCEICTRLEDFMQKEVKFEANLELKEFAKQVYCYYSKGKGKTGCKCEFNGEVVEIVALDEGQIGAIRSKLVEL